MTDTYSDEKYTNYLFEDFLLDDFFISYVIYPNKESSFFWNRLLKEGKVNLDEFQLAKDFVESYLNESEETVSEDELLDLWKRIHNTNKRNNNSKNNPFRKHLYIGLSIASSILLFVFIIPYLSKNYFPNKQEESIIQYVEANSINIDSVSDIQLVLSDKKIVNVTEKESDIIYDSTEIKISSKEILQKEDATVFNQLAVPNGRRSTLKLPDGTHLYVNAGTVVTYPTEFAGDKREIYVNGEIFIDVKPDTKRPFIIRTSNIDVEVLGTKFNVTAYDSDENKQIVLVSGSVKILSRNDKKDTIIKPSEMYQYSEGTSSVKKVDLVKYTSWVDGLYYLESEKLENVMHKLSRYYGVNINCDEKIVGLRCSGKMDLKDEIVDVLDGLSFSFPINIEYKNGEYYITSKNM